MRIVFAGTRGEIEARSERHFRHTSLLLKKGRRRVLIDCGRDWRGEFLRLKPHAIVLTHAHPDHADGLRDGAPCPVYATAATWERIGSYPIEDRRTVECRKAFEVEKIRFEAWPVEHSLRAPAVAYRICGDKGEFVYSPDIVFLPASEDALRGVRLYIGDGASPLRPIVRQQEGSRTGHASMREQLEWCRTSGVSRVTFTHCGSAVVEGDEEEILEKLREAAGEVEVDIAHDGMEVEV